MKVLMMKLQGFRRMNSVMQLKLSPNFISVIRTSLVHFNFLIFFLIHFPILSDNFQERQSFSFIYTNNFFSISTPQFPSHLPLHPYLRHPPTPPLSPSPSSPSPTPRPSPHSYPFSLPPFPYQTLPTSHLPLSPYPPSPLSPLPSPLPPFSDTSFPPPSSPRSSRSLFPSDTPTGVSHSHLPSSPPPSLQTLGPFLGPVFFGNLIPPSPPTMSSSSSPTSSSFLRPRCIYFSVVRSAHTPDLSPSADTPPPPFYSRRRLASSIV